jgi:hypothetical protein
MLDAQATPPKFDAAIGAIAGIVVLALAAWHGMHANWLFAMLMAVVAISSFFNVRKLLRQSPVQQDVRRFSLGSLFLLTAAIAALVWTVAFVIRHS